MVNYSPAFLCSDALETEQPPFRAETEEEEETRQSEPRPETVSVEIPSGTLPNEEQPADSTEVSSSLVAQFPLPS